MAKGKTVCSRSFDMGGIKMIISVFDRVKNIVGKGEIACTSNFSFSHNVFKRLFSQTRQKVSLFRNGLTLMALPNDNILEFRRVKIKGYAEKKSISLKVPIAPN